MWDYSIDDLNPLWAESEDAAINYAIEYMTDYIYNYSDYDKEERAEQLEYWSNPNHYLAELY